jgi:pyruvate formate lyase activating enzyme
VSVVREAKFYETHPQGVLCGLCPKHCIVGEGRTGFCRVRKNIGGTLYTENYGRCSSYAIDPIEKKPLYHFYPGSQILSLGTWGCNFACQFCQNWEIAQDFPQTVELPPDKAVSMAKGTGPDNIGIAYTYSEPSVWYEYILDTAELAHDNGLTNVLVTNGFINQAPLETLLPHIDGMNIDVKAFNDDFYRTICAGELEHVKYTVEMAVQHCHVEITTLVIPGLNDREEEIQALAKWLAGLNPDMPLHFSRYFPRYRLQAPPTPLVTLERAYRIAKDYLNYVYIGNVGDAGVNTYCPSCGLLIINRLSAYSVLEADKKCPQCGQAIAITGEIRF